jgi:hypothetical protein
MLKTMKVLKNHSLNIVILFVVAVYIVCSFEFYNLTPNVSLTWFVHNHKLTNNEGSFFELLSAVSWCFAAILFFLLVRKSWKIKQIRHSSMWFMFFFVLSVFAFGEEISWGSHLFNYSSKLAIVKANAQGEANIHNINLIKILSLDYEKGDFLYPYLRNLTKFLTPAFYLTLALFWVFLPWLKPKLIGCSAIKALPTPSVSFTVFYCCHAVLFIFIDVTLFNVGQVFEMFISLAAVIVALDMGKWLNTVVRSSNLKQSSAALHC